MSVLELHADLHYVQGYHDIVSVFLLVCGEPEAFLLTEKLSMMHIRDSLRPSLKTVMPVLSLVFPLIKQVDTEVYDFFESANVNIYIIIFLK